MITRGLQRADSWVPKARGTSTIQPTEHIMDRYCPVLPASRHWDKEKTRPQAWPLRAPSLAGARLGYKHTGVALHWPSRSARLSPCPRELPLAGPSIRGKPGGGTSKCSFRPLSQATPSANLPLTAFPQELFLNGMWPSRVGPGLEGWRAGRGRRIQLQGPRSLAQGSRPAAARPVGLRLRLCVHGPCPPPSLSIHSPASPSCLGYPSHNKVAN